MWLRCAHEGNHSAEHGVRVRVPLVLQRQLQHLRRATDPQLLQTPCPITITPSFVSRPPIPFVFQMDAVSYFNRTETETKLSQIHPLDDATQSFSFIFFVE